MANPTFSRLKRAALVTLVLTPAMAAAQFSDSYNFLKAVRDRDGNKATELASKPGSTLVDTRDVTTGETPLIIVTKRRDLTWMSFMLGKGAKPDLKDKEGNTPLMHTAMMGFVEGAQILIKSKAGVDIVNSGGETPLIRAVQTRNATLVRMLVTAGANPDKTDRLAGLSARDYAKRDTRAAAIVKILDEAKVVKPAAGPKL